MREIKFRAWVNCTCYDLVGTKYIDKEIMADVQTIHLTTNKVRAVFTQKEHHSHYKIGKVRSYDYKESEYKLMQFTGLKDKNGKEIYEGDIVTDGEDNGLVIFSSDQAQFRVDMSPYEKVFQEMHQYTMWCEVIGNKFENPELLNDN